MENNIILLAKGVYAWEVEDIITDHARVLLLFVYTPTVILAWFWQVKVE